VNPRRLDLHRSGSGRQRPLLGFPVPHHQRMPLLIPLAPHPFHVLVRFGFQGCCNHPSSPVPGKVIQRVLHFRRHPVRFFRGNLEHGVSLP